MDFKATSDYMQEEHWHSDDIETVFEKLNSSVSGLSDQAARGRLLQYGYDELEEHTKESHFQVFMRQFKNPIIYVLIFAALVAFSPGHHADALIIAFILIANSIIGSIQEGRAEQAISSLKKLATTIVKVKRDGNIVDIPARKVVPGGVIVCQTKRECMTRKIKFSVILILLMALLLADIPLAAAPPVDVETGIYIISLGNYDVNKGTYTMDFYMLFRWDAIASNFTPAKFEFMNGRANSRELISDEIDPITRKREVWYRIQAALYSEPGFKEYPFDKQVLKMDFEDTSNTIEKLRYIPLTSESGLDEEVKASGWIIKKWDFYSKDKNYKWGETYSRGNFEIEIEREKTSTAIKTFLPPIIFCIVSGLSFFFRPDKIAQRLGLGTSMLISAVMFHISQTSSLPPLGSLILIDKIMISTYTFLASSLIVTTIIHIDVEWWQNVDYTKETNKYGAIATIVLPIIVYLSLSGL